MKVRVEQSTRTVRFDQCELLALSMAFHRQENQPPYTLDDPMDVQENTGTSCEISPDFEEIQLMVQEYCTASGTKSSAQPHRRARPFKSSNQSTDPPPDIQEIPRVTFDVLECMRVTGRTAASISTNNKSSSKPMKDLTGFVFTDRGDDNNPEFIRDDEHNNPYGYHSFAEASSNTFALDRNFGECNLAITTPYFLVSNNAKCACGSAFCLGLPRFTQQPNRCAANRVAPVAMDAINRIQSFLLSDFEKIYHQLVVLVDGYFVHFKTALTSCTTGEPTNVAKKLRRLLDAFGDNPSACPKDPGSIMYWLTKIETNRPTSNLAERARNSLTFVDTMRGELHTFFYSVLPQVQHMTGADTQCDLVDRIYKRIRTTCGGRLVGAVREELRFVKNYRDELHDLIEKLSSASTSRPVYSDTEKFDRINEALVQSRSEPVINRALCSRQHSFCLRKMFPFAQAQMFMAVGTDIGLGSDHSKRVLGSEVSQFKSPEDNLKEVDPDTGEQCTPLQWNNLLDMWIGPLVLMAGNAHASRHPRAKAICKNVKWIARDTLLNSSRLRHMDYQCIAVLRALLDYPHFPFSSQGNDALLENVKRRINSAICNLPTLIVDEYMFPRGKWWGHNDRVGCWFTPEFCHKLENRINHAMHASAVDIVVHAINITLHLDVCGRKRDKGYPVPVISTHYKAHWFDLSAIGRYLDTLDPIHKNVRIDLRPPGHRSSMVSQDEWQSISVSVDVAAYTPHYRHAEICEQTVSQSMRYVPSGRSFLCLTWRMLTEDDINGEWSLLRRYEPTFGPLLPWSDLTSHEMRWRLAQHIWPVSVRPPKTAFFFDPYGAFTPDPAGTHERVSITSVYGVGFSSRTFAQEGCTGTWRTASAEKQAAWPWLWTDNPTADFVRLFSQEGLPIHVKDDPEYVKRSLARSMTQKYINEEAYERLCAFRGQSQRLLAAASQPHIVDTVPNPFMTVDELFADDGDVCEIQIPRLRGMGFMTSENPSDAALNNIGAYVSTKLQKRSFLWNNLRTHILNDNLRDTISSVIDVPIDSISEHSADSVIGSLRDLLNEVFETRHEANFAKLSPLASKLVSSLYSYGIETDTDGVSLSPVLKHIIQMWMSIDHQYDRQMSCLLHKQSNPKAWARLYPGNDFPANSPLYTTEKQAEQWASQSSRKIARHKASSEPVMLPDNTVNPFWINHGSRSSSCREPEVPFFDPLTGNVNSSHVNLVASYGVNRCNLPEDRSDAVSSRRLQTSRDIQHVMRLLNEEVARRIQSLQADKMSISEFYNVPHRAATASGLLRLFWKNAQYMGSPCNGQKDIISDYWRSAFTVDDIQDDGFIANEVDEIWANTPGFGIPLVRRPLMRPTALEENLSQFLLHE